jgi:CheY-like chemotaxis protein
MVGGRYIINENGANFPPVKDRPDSGHVMHRIERTTRFGPPSSPEASPALSAHQASTRMTPLSHRERRERGQQPLRVLLVEDSPLLVQRISELVEDLPNIELVGTAGTEPEAVARLDAGDVDAVILDLQLHTGSGFGVLRALQRRGTGPAVIVFTNFAIGAYRETAFALGARHFLDKSRDYDRLPAVLQELSESVQ